jgi:hypothetical protein
MTDRRGIMTDAAGTDETTASLEECDEHRLGWDELTYEGRQRRAERMIEAADMRRKEIREDALIRSMNKGGDA